MAAFLPPGLRVQDLTAHDRAELRLAMRVAELHSAAARGADVDPRLLRGLQERVRLAAAANPVARRELAACELRALGAAAREFRALAAGHMRWLHAQIKEDEIAQLVRISLQIGGGRATRAGTGRSSRPMHVLAADCFSPTDYASGMVTRGGQCVLSFLSPSRWSWRSCDWRRTSSQSKTVSRTRADTRQCRSGQHAAGGLTLLLLLS